MKLMFASDIHGILSGCENTISAYKRENAERLILLGDLLYHGPRNGVPEGYDPVKVIDLLNGMKEHILCVRGNCEAEVDQMVLPFPCMADYALVCADGRTIIAAHGHKEHPIPAQGEILVTGHTHVSLDVMEQGYRHLNPGSISLPKEGTAHGYIVIEDGAVQFREL